MGLNDLAVSYGKVKNSPDGTIDKSMYWGVGMDINIYENVVNTGLHMDRCVLEETFSRYMPKMIKDTLFSCTVEKEATLDVIDRYYIGDENVRLFDPILKVNYDSGSERVEVCASLPKILTWLAFGKNPIIFIPEQIRLAYSACRELLNVYAEDPTSLVKLGLPEEVSDRIKKFIECLEYSSKDIINPTIERYDSPVTTFLEDRFKGLFESDMKTIEETNGVKTANGFIIEDQNEEEFSNSWN